MSLVQLGDVASRLDGETGGAGPGCDINRDTRRVMRGCFCQVIAAFRKCYDIQ